MSRFIKFISTAAIALTATAAFAAPEYLITANHTNLNGRPGAVAYAYLYGKLPPSHPIMPGETYPLPWSKINFLCSNRPTCPATIRMGGNSSDTGIEIAQMVLNVSTGDITPSLSIQNGYKIEVTGPGYIVITNTN